MYGLKETGIISFKHLVQNLVPHGYYPMKFIPSMWRHKYNDLVFTLAVDEFEIKYFN